MKKSDIILIKFYEFFNTLFLKKIPEIRVPYK